MYLLNLAQLWALTLPAGMSTPPKWSRNVLMCLRNLQTKFGAWGPNEAEILTFPPPMYLLNLAWIWVLVLYPWVCQHLQGGLEMFLCVSGTSKKLVHGP